MVVGGIACGGRIGGLLAAADVGEYHGYVEADRARRDA